MKDITRHPAVCWLGATDLVAEGDGIRPTRVPRESGYQLSLPTAFTAGMCSGVRLAFRTDAEELRLVVNTIRVQVDGADPHPACFDLVVEGETVAERDSEDGVLLVVDRNDINSLRMEEGGPATLEFKDLDPVMKSVEIWLPHTAQVTVSQIAVDADSAVEPPHRGPSWIHYGSSISHCMDADRPGDIWPVVAARNSGQGFEVTNMGYSGECQIDQFVARYIRDSNPALISAKLGINTLTTLVERTFRSAVHGFLDTVRDGHPTTPLVVCSPIFSPDFETDPHTSPEGEGRPEAVSRHFNATLTTTRIRSILEEVVASRKERGDEHLHYLHGFELLGPDDADDLPDRIHPNTAGYARMGQRFARKVLGESGLLAQYQFN